MTIDLVKWWKRKMMRSLTAGKCLPGDTRRSLSRRSGVTGGPKPNSSWPSWERSSDLGTSGGFPTCATKTAGVSGFTVTATPPHPPPTHTVTSPQQESREVKMLSFLQVCSSSHTSCSCLRAGFPCSSSRLPSDSTQTRVESHAGERSARFSKVLFPPFF